MDATKSVTKDSKEISLRPLLQYLAFAKQYVYILQMSCSDFRLQWMVVYLWNTGKYGKIIIGNAMSYELGTFHSNRTPKLVLLTPHRYHAPRNPAPQKTTTTKTKTKTKNPPKKTKSKILIQTKWKQNVENFAVFIHIRRERVTVWQVHLRWLILFDCRGSFLLTCFNLNPNMDK